ncbi:MAG: T9SS type A sorting domain-containing protein, partial [Bacteroidota bacterium]
GGDTTGAFFCPDGTCSVALDNTGKAHVVFGLQRASGDEAGGKYWYPFTDGVVYWNENMPALPEMMNWDSLYANGNLIGWVTDSMVWYAASTELAYYYNSMTAYPNIIADASGDLYAVWAGVTDLRDINNYMLRHLFGTASLDNGENWSEDIQHLTDDFLYTWSECVFPFVAKNSTDYLYLIMQEDGEAGLQFYGAQGAQGQAAITQNNMIVMTIDKSRFWPIAVEETHGSSFQVSPPYPNPVKDLTAMTLILENPGDVSVHVYSLIGQHVQNLNKGRLQAGPHELLVDASGMKAGVYFISVKVGDQVQTRKMIVE